eukprot:1282934-Rhodomonas_salina.1
MGPDTAGFKLSASEGCQLAAVEAQAAVARRSWTRLPTPLLSATLSEWEWESMARGMMVAGTGTRVLITC